MVVGQHLLPISPKRTIWHKIVIHESMFMVTDRKLSPDLNHRQQPSAGSSRVPKLATMTVSLPVPAFKVLFCAQYRINTAEQCSPRYYSYNPLPCEGAHYTSLITDEDQ